LSGKSLFTNRRRFHFMKRLMIAFSFLSAFLPALAAQSAPPPLTLTFSGNDFAGVCDVNKTQDVTLDRTGGTGNVDITINSISIGGTNASEFVVNTDDCTGKIVPCLINITFTPGGFFAGNATLTVNATGAANTTPPDSGNLDIPLTGVGQGCGDGVKNCQEQCDFNNLAAKDCCDGTCKDLASASPIPCDIGACQTGGTCNQNNGTCQPGTTTPADSTTACQDDPCLTASTCTGGNTSSCDQSQSTVVICTPIDECHLAETCVPFSGCTNNPAAPDGTGCSIGTCQGGVCTASGGTATGGTATAGTATGGTATGGTATAGTATGGTATGGTATAGTATGGTNSKSGGCSLSAQSFNGYAIAVWGGILIAVAGIVVLRRRQS
jgi:hypothetical protein